MNRIDRLHAIVVHLQSKKKVKAQEIADRFGLSLRTVYRDIKAIDESGVPVIGEAGSGYTIMEGYRLPPLMFSREEASALLLGAKFAEGFANENNRKHTESAVYKIKAVLRGLDKDYVNALAAGISIAPSRLPVEETGGHYLFPLQQALAQKKRVQINYYSLYDDRNSIRDIEPIGICYYNTCWHLIAWCCLRKDYRDFRISRMSQLQVKEETFDHTKHLSLDQYLKTVLQSQPVEEMIVDFDKEVARMIREVKYFHGFVSEEETDTHCRMKFLTAYPDIFGRWLLSFTDAVNIVSPAVLRDIMRKLATEAMNQWE